MFDRKHFEFYRNVDKENVFIMEVEDPSGYVTDSIKMTRADALRLYQKINSALKLDNELSYSTIDEVQP